MIHKKGYLSPIMEVIELDAKVLADAITASGDYTPNGDWSGEWH